MKQIEINYDGSQRQWVVTACKDGVQVAQGRSTTEVGAYLVLADHLLDEVEVQPGWGSASLAADGEGEALPPNWSN